jgi:RNA polymerase sigma factor (sigma-70 family)
MTASQTRERFETLLAEHRGILYKVCNSYCRNREDREDLAQEITLQLWRSFAGFEERTRFSTWMYRVALNVAISFYRRESTRARHVTSGDELVLQNAVDRTPGGSDDLAQLYEFIDRLDPLNKALVLLYLDGNSYREIAEVLGLSETNVATKIGRLKKALKEEQEND